ncbi:MAG: TolC family protein [Planctomycetota bacterium]
MSPSSRSAPAHVSSASALLACVLATGGCVSDVQFASTQELRQSIVDSAQRELREAQQFPEPRTVPRPPQDDLGFTPERRTELERMAGPDSYVPGTADAGVDLLGHADSGAFALALEQAVAASVESNLAVQSARLTPAISGAQVIEAQAAFDWVFFADFAWNAIDQPSIVPVVNGIPVGNPAQLSQSVAYETGVRRNLISGGAIEISQGSTYIDNETPGAAFSPDPANEAFIEIDVAQPLLEGFGSDVALAQVRLAQNTERTAIQSLRQQLINTVRGVETAYWRLYAAYRILQVQQRLLDRGIETRDVLEARREFDVRPAEFSDAVATVEDRRGNVIVAQNELRLASDELKLLINNDAFTIGSEVLLLPLDVPPAEPIQFSVLDSITAALAHRPDIASAILSIDDASIEQLLADNARLPALDLTFQARFNGLGGDLGDAYGDVAEAGFVDLALGLQFEQAIGNRADEAAARAAQLGRLQEVVNYRAAVQNAVGEVKASLRNIQTNYRLIEQARTTRLAATENLRTLEVLEETTQSLTPDFLDLKFTRQEALAIAEINEINALADYNISISDLYAAQGTALERNRIAVVVPDYPGNISPSW